jgi:phosphopentomutase
MKRALLLVLDSVGCGHAPDAAVYGDAGADTLGHLFGRVAGLELPAMASLGLYHLLRGLDQGFPLAVAEVRQGAAWGVMREQSAGKDTTTGHWELAGCVLEKPFHVFEKFPADLVGEIGHKAGVKFLGNVVASGPAVIDDLGEEHISTGKPILYTSADSVMQIAAHEDPAVFGLQRLLDLCVTARRVLDERGLRVGRVIARPFVGECKADFRRTANRHDYSLVPPPTVLNRLQAAGVRTIGVGKVEDIFAGSGISESHVTKSNADGMETIARLWAEKRDEPHLLFANLVDFDMLFGHRRDPDGYANSLREFDGWLGSFLGEVGPGDFLMITADHGNDPYHAGTDHTRELVPLLTMNAPFSLRPDAWFTQAAALLEAYFQTGTSLP